MPRKKHVPLIGLKAGGYKSRKSRNQYDPLKRLAAAVIVRALQDWVVWQTPEAVEFRELYRRKLKVAHGMTAAVAAELRNKQARREKLRRQLGMFGLSAAQASPETFLRSESVFHAILGLDMEMIEDMMNNPSKLKVGRLAL